MEDHCEILEIGDPQEGTEPFNANGTFNGITFGFSGNWDGKRITFANVYPKHMKRKGVLAMVLQSIQNDSASMFSIKSV